MDTSQKQTRHRIPVVDFVPAQLKKGNKGKWRIEFYVPDPTSDSPLFKRIQRRVKPMDNVRERERFARIMCVEITRKLERGWNPFIEMEAPNSFRLMKDVIKQFLNNIKKEIKDGTLRPDTFRSYKSFLKNFRDWLEKRGEENLYCLKFNRQVVNDFLDHIYYERDNSPRTYNNYLSFFNTFSTWMISREFLSVNPAEGFKKKPVGEKKRKTIPEKDLKKIFDHLKNHNPGFGVACGMVYFELIRRTEMSKMFVSDIYLRQKFIELRADISKNKKTQYVTILDEFLPMLADHLKKAASGNFLFSTNNFLPGKEPLQPKAFSDQWSKVRKELNLPKEYQFYSFKDTGITNLLKAGVAPVNVREHARHHDLGMTDKYLQKGGGVAPEHLDGKLKM